MSVNFIQLVKCPGVGGDATIVYQNRQEESTPVFQGTRLNTL